MMIEKGKINNRQLKILVLLFYLGSTVLIVPSVISLVARQDSWLSAIIGAALGMLLIWLYASLGKRYPNLSLIEYSELILGKWVGKLVGLVFVGFFFLLAVLVLRNIGDFVTTIVMPETPIQAIHIILMGCVVIAMRLGLEVLGRASELFFPGILALVVVLLVFITPQIKLERIEPMLENSFMSIMQGSLTVLGIPFLELVVFLMIIPYVNKQSKAGGALFTGAIVGSIILILLTTLCVLVLGWDFTSRHAFPTYTFAKKIHIGEFIQRIEVFMGIIWLLTMFFKVAVAFYAAALGLAQLLRLSHYRPTLLPLGMIAVVLSLIVYPDIVYFRAFSREVWLAFAMTFGLLFPAALMMVSLIRQSIAKRNR